ncbi:MAG: DUF402 domain-containing protein [Chloroflexia bacterium]|nr:DUF402 domain-containing protein [Chloroflexia bacterium]
MTGKDRTIEIVKFSPSGKQPVRYTGTLIDCQDGWIAARANWVHGDIDLGYLTFFNGDVLDEYFALDRPYNAFALFRVGGEFAGWYCNVTHPTTVTGGEIHWHDLYLDVIVYPDGRALVLDEDELHESALEVGNPDLHAMILAGRDELLEMVKNNAYPFSEIA